MIQKSFLIAFICLLFGCSSFDAEVHPLFYSSKFDCGNGISAITQRICAFERWGY